jgi:hypothetical protein
MQHKLGGYTLLYACERKIKSGSDEPGRIGNDIPWEMDDTWIPGKIFNAVGVNGKVNGRF